jgi:hypothetical protein
MKFPGFYALKTNERDKVLALTGALATPRLAHNFERDEHDWYVEPIWCSQRLFEEEKFDGEVWDPCCGWGRIVRSAIDAGHPVKASDIIIRPSGDAAVDKLKVQADFRDLAGPAVNIVCNPPYSVLPTFTQAALKLAQRKVAVIFPVARLNDRALDHERAAAAHLVDVATTADAARLLPGGRP